MNHNNQQPGSADRNECAANMNGHRFGAHGRKGEQQCEWCGEAAPAVEQSAEKVLAGWEAYALSTSQDERNDELCSALAEIRKALAAPVSAGQADENRIKYLEGLVNAYGPKSLQYDIEHPNDGLNSASQAVQVAKADDMLHELQKRVWEALDRRACPGMFLQVASDVILGFKTDSYGGSLAAPVTPPDAVQALRDLLSDVQAGVLDGDAARDAQKLLDNMEDPTGCILHARKKLLVPGTRTGGKSMRDDIKEARDTLTRYLELTAPEEFPVGAKESK